MTIWKRIKRLWTLLTTEEVFDEHGSRGRRKDSAQVASGLQREMRDH
jgi:hypothetical protein